MFCSSPFLQDSQPLRNRKAREKIKRKKMTKTRPPRLQQKANRKSQRSSQRKSEEKRNNKRERERERDGGRRRIRRRRPRERNLRCKEKQKCNLPIWACRISLYIPPRDRLPGGRSRKDGCPKTNIFPRKLPK